LSKGYINEIFASVQGEGQYLGARQVFVRLAGCSLGCGYCDTDFGVSSRVDVFGAVLMNPAEPSVLYELVSKACPKEEFHSVSFTGGEPLEQPAFLAESAVLFKNSGWTTFLETSGCVTEGLAELRDIFDIFSIDIKMCRQDWREHLKNLLPVLKYIDNKYYLKLIFDDKNSGGEFRELARILKSAGISRIFAQAVDNHANYVRIENLQKTTQKEGVTVFYRPQIHKFVGMR
jgi:organic radical activating enzyme